MSALTAALQQAGMNAMKAGHLQEAVSVLQQAAAADPNAALTFAYLGVAYSQMSDYESARHAFGRAVQIEPQSARARFNLGVAHKMAGDIEAARTCFDCALQFDPHY